MNMAEQLIALIAPHSCLGCKQEGPLLCTPCATALPRIVSRCYRCNRITDSFKTCRSCRSSSDLFAVYGRTHYDNIAKNLVHALKYERARAAARDIAQALASGLSSGGYDAVVPIPTASSRVRERGYDQAVLIAKELARLTGLPYVPLLVRRGNQRQVGQLRNARKKQMLDAFYVRESTIASRHALLIDDVLTTGSTCEAAATVLRKAGVKRVSGAVFAVA